MLARSVAHALCQPGQQSDGWRERAIDGGRGALLAIVYSEILEIETKKRLCVYMLVEFRREASSELQ